MKNRVKAFLLSVVLIAAMPSLVAGNEMEAEAVSHSVNIITTFGISETRVYDVPNAFNARYANIAARVSGLYASLGLAVNFTRPATGYVREAPADTCGLEAESFTMICRHSSLVECDNYGPYHCTNAFYNMLDIFPRPRPFVDGIEMYMTAMPLCVMKDGHHHLVSGMAYTGTIIARDWDHEDIDNPAGNSDNVLKVSATVAHELGHLYGAVDHYNTFYGDERDNCIWGYHHNTDYVLKRISVCSDCYQTLYASISAS